jgi:hypothetical protein
MSFFVVLVSHKLVEFFLGGVCHREKKAGRVAGGGAICTVLRCVEAGASAPRMSEVGDSLAGCKGLFSRRRSVSAS